MINHHGRFGIKEIVIRLSKSSITSKEIKAVTNVLEQEYLGMGTEVKKFEDELKQYLGTDRHVICVNTGTSALILALVAAGVGPGDQVLVPTITYVASFQAVSSLGAEPIACDVDEKTLLIDLLDADRRVSAKTKAIMPVHYAGNAGNMDAVFDFAKVRDLRIIEDAAHSFGSKLKGNLIGKLGDLTCFSFDGIKNITCGEGGAIIVSSRDEAERLQDARLLGVVKDTSKRFTGRRSWQFEVKDQGYRFHMSNINAALGRVQLGRLDEFSAKRRAICASYMNLLEDVAEITFPHSNLAETTPHIAPIFAADRDALRDHLLEHSIETGIHYFPNHLLSKFRAKYKLPTAERIFPSMMTLPCHNDLSSEDINKIVTAVKSFYGEG